MVREITKDIFFLGQKSEPATEADIQIGRDLQDTLKAHRAECVGMAANMIGIKKNVIIVNMGIVDLVMFNPVLLKKSGPYETEEGCLSLDRCEEDDKIQRNRSGIQRYELDSAPPETQWLDGTNLSA